MVVFTLRFAQKAVIIFKINVCGISTQQLVYSVNLEWYLYRTCYPWHMHYDWKIECLEVENVNTHTRMAYRQFHNGQFSQCDLVAQVAFREEVASGAEAPSVLVQGGGSSAPPACQRIFSCTILAWKAAGHVILLNHCPVAFHHSLHHRMPRTLNSSHLLFSEFGVRFL